MMKDFKNNNEFVEITKLVTPAGLNNYYDNFDKNEYNKDKLIMHKYDIKLCVALIFSHEYLIGSLPIYLCPIAHKDKYEFEYFDKIEAYDYYSRKELFRLKKHNNGIKILTLDNKDYKNIKIKLYEISDTMFLEIDNYNLLNDDKLISLVLKNK